MDVWAHERLMQFVPRDVVDPRARRRMMAEEADYRHILPSRSGKRLSDSGILINVGAHGLLQGLGYHWEMWNLAQGGMTPMDMLRGSRADRGNDIAVAGSWSNRVNVCNGVNRSRLLASRCGTLSRPGARLKTRKKRESFSRSAR